MKIQVEQYRAMPELRKLLQPTNNVFAITIPNKYAKALELKRGDYVEISLWEKGALKVKRHEAPKKS